MGNVPYVGEYFNIIEKDSSHLNDKLDTTMLMKEKEKIEDVDSDKDEVDNGFISFLEFLHTGLFNS